MNCPFCEHTDTRVMDSRVTEDGRSIRRRRRCMHCSSRFTTYERYEETPLLVLKKDGRREHFDRRKVLDGLLRACEKRPVSSEAIQEMAARIEQELRSLGKTEVSAGEIGELVMESLLHLDEVAYVRFASVYKEFKDVNRFAEELQLLDALRKRTRAEEET